jgi:hypothetical protein
MELHGKAISVRAKKFFQERVSRGAVSAEFFLNAQDEQAAQKKIFRKFVLRNRALKNIFESERRSS